MYSCIICDDTTRYGLADFVSAHYETSRSFFSLNPLTPPHSS